MERKMKNKIMKMVLTTLCMVGCCGVLLSMVAAANDKQSWTPLFDGDTLSGWEQRNGTAHYRIEDGVIIGKTTDGSPNSFLCTTKHYGDFVLEFDVKCDPHLNSGVQIRSKSKEDSGRVYGPQVEIESTAAGGLSGYVYGEATGRGWLTPESVRKRHQHFDDAGWNHYRIRAQGPIIETWINGQKIGTLDDQKAVESHPEGFIGLQVHGIGRGQGPYEVQWRNIRIQPL